MTGFGGSDLSTSTAVESPRTKIRCDYFGMVLVVLCKCRRAQSCHCHAVGLTCWKFKREEKGFRSDALNALKFPSLVVQSRWQHDSESQVMN